MSGREGIINKILHLREMTVSRGATKAEAEMFAVKAANLMVEYAIEENEITTPADHIMTEEEIKYICPWRRTLLNAIGRVCFVSVCYVKGSCEIKLVGRPLNIEAFKEMFRFIEKQCIQVSRQLYPGTHLRDKQRRAEGGLAYGVCEKLREHNARNAESFLPVVQEYEAAQEAMGELIPNIVARKNRNQANTLEMRNGYANANRIKLRLDVEN